MPHPDMSRTEEMLRLFDAVVGDKYDEDDGTQDALERWLQRYDTAIFFVRVAFWLDTQHVNRWSHAQVIDMRHARHCVGRWHFERDKQRREA